MCVACVCVCVCVCVCACVCVCVRACSCVCMRGGGGGGGEGYIHALVGLALENLFVLTGTTKNVQKTSLKKYTNARLK